MKRLIITCDDLGIAQSVNDAAYEALTLGAITSASVMVPGPAFLGVCAYARTHPHHDFGVHLTLTSGRKYSKWRPVLPTPVVPSLVDDAGCFWETPAAFLLHAVLEDVRKEITAQVLRAMENGITPTHLDVHESVLLGNVQLLNTYIRAAHEFGVPLRVSRSVLTRLFVVDYPGIPLDGIFSITPSTSPDEWPRFYHEVLRDLKDGLHELVVHLGHDNGELQAITRDRPAWGAHWRQRDFDAVTSPDFRSLLRREGIKLVGWRDILELSTKTIAGRLSGRYLVLG